MLRHVWPDDGQLEDLVPEWVRIIARQRVSALAAGLGAMVDDTVGVEHSPFGAPMPRLAASLAPCRLRRGAGRTGRIGRWRLGCVPRRLPKLRFQFRVLRPERRDLMLKRISARHHGQKIPLKGISTRDDRSKQLLQLGDALVSGVGVQIHI